MMHSEGYRIIDEPQPGALANIAVSPVWPLFAYMFGGAWFAWFWFVANGFALGSPTRLREAALVAGGFIGVVVIWFITGLVFDAGILHKEQVLYALLVVTLWKLGITYWLFELQNRSFDLYQYFGGTVRSGMYVVVAGYLTRTAVLNVAGGGLLSLLVV